MGKLFGTRFRVGSARRSIRGDATRDRALVLLAGRRVSPTRSVVLAAVLGVAAAPLTAQAPTSASAWVIFGADTIRVEVASTPEERQRGLMERESVPDGTGMLFVFDQTAVHSIWMKDTYVPLDVAFLDPSFRIVNIESLEPLDLTIKDSVRPVLFALEVRQGWFADHGIEAGARALIELGRR